MRKSKKLVLLALLCLSICGCSSSNESSQENVSPDTQNSSDKLALETFSAQIEYYSDLVSQLQNQILNEKERNYIEECEYKLQIKDLELQIQTLTNQLNSIKTDAGSSKPTEAPSQDITPNPQTPSLSETAVKSSFKYSIKNGEVTITEYTGSDSNVTVPKLIEGLPVTAIGDSAFKGSNITSVILPEGLKQIDWFAFSDCVCLESITIPSSVSSVGYGAFNNCHKTMKIICHKGSYIESYAASWGILFSNE